MDEKQNSELKIFSQKDYKDLQTHIKDLETSLFIKIWIFLSSIEENFLFNIELLVFIQREQVCIQKIIQNYGKISQKEKKKNLIFQNLI